MILHLLLIFSHINFLIVVNQEEMRKCLCVSLWYMISWLVAIAYILASSHRLWLGAPVPNPR